MAFLKTRVLVTLLLLTGFSCDIREKNGSISGNLLSAPIPLFQASFAGQDDTLAAFRSKVKALFDSVFAKRPLNGGVLVAKGSEIIYEDYQGSVGFLTGKQKMDASAAFHLASISKTMTAVATLKLWEDGKLDLNQDIATYLPGFALRGVTVKMLLNHRSGIPNYVNYMEQLGWNKQKRVTNKDVFNFLNTHVAKIAIAPPNTRFEYSNTNYALLALIIEKISGMFLGDYLKQTIFEPLGMKDTYVFTLADSARSMPSFYLDGRKFAFTYLDLVYGDKNVYSTPRDLLRYDIGLKRFRILKAATLDSAYRPYSFEKQGTANYGLGWRMHLVVTGKKIIYHNGWWHGNRGAFIRLLDEDVTIITLCNNDNTSVYDINRLADIFGEYCQTKVEPPVTAVKAKPTNKKVSVKPSKNRVAKKKNNKSFKGTPPRTGKK